MAASVTASGLSHPAYAATGKMNALPPDLNLQKLVTITTDRDSNTRVLNIALNQDQDVQGIDFSQSQANAFFTLGEIDSQSGVVLDSEQGRNAILLKGSIDVESPSNRLTISYLSNGLSNSYNDCDILVEKAENEQWVLLNAYTQQPVEQILVKTWMLGITTLEGICQE